MLASRHDSWPDLWTVNASIFKRCKGDTYLHLVTTTVVTRVSYVRSPKVKHPSSEQRQNLGHHAAQRTRHLSMSVEGIVSTSRRRLLLVCGPGLDAADDVGGGEALCACHGHGDAHLARHPVIWIILRIGESLQILLAECDHVDLVFREELLRKAKAWRIPDDLRHALATCHLGLPLIRRHHRRPLVVVRVLVAHDADVEPVA
mmetsp:Transcript_168653/g.541938  ORF Transcript_168653/g.541938 Transcript_168653/m.541938 type:complete len:203 (+) Transcript_168653:23-631(+)